MSTEPLSLAFTGHMIDLPGRSPPRFPPELVDAARIEIERSIARHTEGGSKGSVKGFASLARGGDILHEICRSFDFDTVIILPLLSGPLPRDLGRRRRRRGLAAAVPKTLGRDATRPPL